MYDYAVEMMKKYHPEDNEEHRREPDYDRIAEGLFIVTEDGDREEVDENVKRLFRESYEKYVERRLHANKEKLAIIMFQGSYKPIIQRNQPRSGMVYIEDSVRKVINNLPQLPKGEIYAFPSLRIIRTEEGSEAFMFFK